VWKTFAKLQGSSHEDLSVVIEDVQFHRATIMPKEGENFTSHLSITSCLLHFKYEYCTGLFKMIVGVQLSSGNSAPNLGNIHHLIIPFEGGMHSFKRQGVCVSQS